MDDPNKFVSTEVKHNEVGDRLTMKISRQLVDILLEVSVETYQDCVVKENGHKAIYLTVLHTRHGHH
jgi:hypothetical protein